MGDGRGRGQRLAALAGSLAEARVVAGPRTILDDYGRVGGALVAGGLAFSALFALVPAVLLVLGIAGLVVADDARRAELVAGIASHLPPLHDLIETSLGQMARDAASVSVIGLVGLAWGASRFYVALEDAFARVFVGAPRRGLVRRTVWGIASVAVLIVAVVASIAITAVASFLEASLAARLSGSAGAWRVLSPALAAVVAVAAVAVVYRAVPASHPGWRTVLPPAIAVGVALAVLTQVFVIVAPRLVGAAAVYGAFGAVFAALAWLGLGFQALLLGACWVRRRMPSGD